MTLADYVNQEQPEKLPIGTVKLEQNEYTVITNTKTSKVIHLHLFNYNYILLNDSKILFTGDKQGNAKQPTVFCLK